MGNTTVVEGESSDRAPVQLAVFDLPGSNGGIIGCRTNACIDKSSVSKAQVAGEYPGCDLEPVASNGAGVSTIRPEEGRVRVVLGPAGGFLATQLQGLLIIILGRPEDRSLLRVFVEHNGIHLGGWGDQGLHSGELWVEGKCLVGGVHVCKLCRSRGLEVCPLGRTVRQPAQMECTSY
jgi:hypothetical protein